MAIRNDFAPGEVLAAADLNDTFDDLRDGIAALEAAVVQTNAQTTSYTLVLSDASKIIEMSNSSPTTITVPTDSNVAFLVGTTIDIIQMGTGQTSIAGASGVTVDARNGLKINGQYSGASLLKRATNTWLLIGATIA